MKALTLAILYAFNESPREIAVHIANNLNPLTPEQAAADGEYVLHFLVRERIVFGRNHPANPCDTLHMVREMRTWSFPSGVDEEALLYEASLGRGKCAQQADHDLAQNRL
jgi:hypothetical protein